MESITRKPVIKNLVDQCLTAYQQKGLEACVQQVHGLLLTQKVKFPLLEYAATLLYDNILLEEQVTFCDQIEPYKTIGGHVLLGSILQKRLETSQKEAFEKAAEYISKADTWHICDIIGERVWGYSLLHTPKDTLPVFQQLTTHPSRWVVRSLGAGAHYAIKKGLPKHHADTVFQLLLSMAHTKDKEIKQGVGWAAKTTAKFHPDIIEKYKARIEDVDHVGGWFRTKVKIGLNRHQYAKGN